MTSEIPSVKFSNGFEIPILGLGTWKSKPGEVTAAVKAAIDCGYRHIDCALLYQNEPEVGQAIKEKIADGTVRREDLFITSKLWNTHHAEDEVLGQIQISLNNLGLEYLDLYLIHWPMGYKAEGRTDGHMDVLYSDVDYVDTWRGMEACAQKGLARSIGVSNFSAKQIQRVLEVAKIKPVNNQVELHPYLVQAKLVAWCQANGIAVTAYSPLGSPDRPWAKPGEKGLMDDERIVAMAARYGKTPAQLLIKYQMQRGVIVIPKSVTPARIQSNKEVLDFSLSEEDVKTLESFDCNGRVCHCNEVKDHPHFPFNDEF